MDITWAEPPEMRRGGGRPPSENWQQIAYNLRERPGYWAVVKTVAGRSNSQRIRSQIMTAELVAFEPAGSFEATVRRSDDGGFEVYARKVQ